MTPADRPDRRAALLLESTGLRRGGRERVVDLGHVRTHESGHVGEVGKRPAIAPVAGRASVRDHVALADRVRDLAVPVVDRLHAEHQDGLADLLLMVRRVVGVALVEPDADLPDRDRSPPGWIDVLIAGELGRVHVRRIGGLRAPVAAARLPRALSSWTD